MSKTLLLKFQLAEASGEIPRGSAYGLTCATIAEMAIKKLAEGFYGESVINKAMQAVQESKTKSEQDLLDYSESVIEDIAEVTSILKETHTTSDFPIALANLRKRELRAAYEGPVSDWRSFASVTQTPDFKPIRSLGFSELPELLLRPEGSDVKFASFSEREDGYSVMHYERGISYTWEMWKNDEYGAFQKAMLSMGRAARRLEAMVVFRAILAGLPRITTSGIAGAPTIATLKALRQDFGTRSFTDSDGVSIPLGYDITDIVYGIANRDSILQILTAETEPATGGQKGNFANILRGAFTSHFERLWDRIFGTDYVVFDNQVDWLEVAFLDEFANGPLIYTRLPDVREHPTQGSFRNHNFEVKIGHALGAKVIEPNGAARVAGA